MLCFTHINFRKLIILDKQNVILKIDADIESHIHVSELLNATDSLWQFETF